MVRKLDFICIGAAKSATSTLFELIKDHPDIYVPSAKEIPFFNEDENYKKGWRWYTETFFSDAKKGQIVGTLTPQYMSGTGSNSPDIIAERIKKQLPDVKIIMMARHPVERAYSHFKMHRRQGFIDNTFKGHLEDVLSNDLEAERENLSHRNAFLFAGEYGRILEHYQKLFGKDKVLVVLTDELENSPRDTLTKILKFLEVSTSYLPKKIDRKTNQGGMRPKITFLSPAFIRKFPFIKAAWQRLVPANLRKKIYLKIMLWNTRVDNSQIDKSSNEYLRLVNFYKQDIEKFEELIGQKTPWEEFSNEKSSTQ